MKKIIDDKDKIIYQCPYCSAGRIEITKSSAHRYGYCDTCGAAYIHYVPLPHQLDVHKDKHKIKLLLGG